MVENLFAALMVTACAVMLLRLGLGERRRYRFDALMRTAWSAALGHSKALWHWRRRRALARLAAEDALRRARQGVDREGNVIRPEAFRSPRKPH